MAITLKSPGSHVRFFDSKGNLATPDENGEVVLSDMSELQNYLAAGYTMQSDAIDTDNLVDAISPAIQEETLTFAAESDLIDGNAAGEAAGKQVLVNIGGDPYALDVRAVGTGT